MNNKVKDIIVSVMFVSIILGFFILNIVIKDKDISYSERRKLAKFPNLNKVLEQDFNDDIENYAMDNFVFRDKFRSIKTYFKLDILKQKDNNNLFVLDNVIYKMLYPLDEKSVNNFTFKINNIYEKYLVNNSNVYYTIVPDKNYYLHNSKGYLKLNYDDMISYINKNINSNMEYIDITDTLNMQSYYRTDSHWKQESIKNTVFKIASQMGTVDNIKLNFEQTEYGKFYGAYYGQLGKSMEPDKIYYLTNKVIKEATTYNYETKKEEKVYDISKADRSLDKYDLFLSGATPIIQINNNISNTNKELIIFRDSFGSSIAPLLLEAYSKITLIDTRYIATDLISNYVDFNNKDILFIYSTLLINESGVLK